MKMLRKEFKTRRNGTTGPFTEDDIIYFSSAVNAAHHLYCNEKNATSDCRWIVQAAAVWFRVVAFDPSRCRVHHRSMLVIPCTFVLSASFSDKGKNVKQ
jgi:hypothetical protein